jgi:hypothetical protein
VRELDQLLDIFLARSFQTPRLRQSTGRPSVDAANLGYDIPEAADYEDAQNTTSDLESSRPQNVRKCPVVEISSPSSGAGKTQLLYYIIALSILPESFQGIPLGGSNAAVVVLDTDMRFDVHRLAKVTGAIVNRKANQVKQVPVADTEKAMEDVIMQDGDYGHLIRDILQHVHIFRPQSSSALLSTVQSLSAYLLDLQQHVSATRMLHSIILDSASAFFWQDRLRENIARTEDIGRSAPEIEQDRKEGRTFHIQNIYQDIVNELKRLQTCFDCSVVFTTWGISSASKSTSARDRHGVSSVIYTGPPSFRPHLPFPWGTFPTLRLVVQRDAVRPFGLGTTIVEAETDAPIRQEVVCQGRFSAWVNFWGREEWANSTLNAIDRLPDRGSFPFWITDDGVFTDE